MNLAAAVAKHGRPVVVVVEEEFDRLKALDTLATSPKRKVEV